MDVQTLFPLINTLVVKAVVAVFVAVARCLKIEEIQFPKEVPSKGNLPYFIISWVRSASWAGQKLPSFLNLQLFTWQQINWCIIHFRFTACTRNREMEILRSQALVWLDVAGFQAFWTNPSQHCSQLFPHVLCSQRHTSRSGSVGCRTSHAAACPLHIHLPPMDMSLML